MDGATLDYCWDCGLVQRCPAGNRGDVQCSRCGALLRRRHPHSFDAVGLGAAIGLLLLALGAWLPLATITLPGGRFVRVDLLSALARVGDAGDWGLVVAAGGTMLLLPALKMASVFGFWMDARTGTPHRLTAQAFTLTRPLATWAMIDVFLLGAMVALFRMRSWGDVDLGPGLGALAAAACCSLLVDVLRDPDRFWSRVQPGESPAPRAERESRAEGESTVACPHCGLVRPHERLAPDEKQECVRCHRHLSARKPASLRRATALTCAGILLLFPANFLPIMSITKMGRGGTGTIWHGIVQLTKDGYVGLALIVFVASLLVPIFKLLANSYLILSTRRRSQRHLIPRTRVYRLLVAIGRWSMIDVFATLTLVGLARFGFLGQVLPASGALAFCAVVFVTMWAVEAFDPRLMWDAALASDPGEATS